jgi:hypothetical protein
MAPKHLRGAETGFEPKSAAGAVSPSVRREGPPREDTAFMEEIVRELAAQNEHARSDGASSSTPGGAPIASTGRPRTVRVERDSGFRTPEGVPSARAYLPVRTVAPGRTEPMETETVKVSDPRRLPTVKVPRERDDSGKTVITQPARRMGHLEDSAPTLRSAPAAAVPSEPPRASLAFWIGAVILAALAGVLVVALAARFWPAVSAQGQAIERGTAASGSSEGRGATTAMVPHPANGTAAAAPSAVPSASAAVPADPSVRSPAGPRSDRWF